MSWTTIWCQEWKFSLGTREQLQPFKKAPRRRRTLAYGERRTKPEMMNEAQVDTRVLVAIMGQTLCQAFIGSYLSLSLIPQKSAVVMPAM